MSDDPFVRNNSPSRYSATKVPIMRNEGNEIMLGHQVEAKSSRHRSHQLVVTVLAVMSFCCMLAYTVKLQLEVNDMISNLKSVNRRLNALEEVEMLNQRREESDVEKPVLMTEAELTKNLVRPIKKENIVRKGEASDNDLHSLPAGAHHKNHTKLTNALPGRPARRVRRDARTATRDKPIIHLMGAGNDFRVHKVYSARPSASLIDRWTCAYADGITYSNGWVQVHKTGYYHVYCQVVISGKQTESQYGIRFKQQSSWTNFRDADIKVKSSIVEPTNFGKRPSMKREFSHVKYTARTMLLRRGEKIAVVDIQTAMDKQERLYKMKPNMSFFGAFFIRGE